MTARGYRKEVERCSMHKAFRRLCTNTRRSLAN